MENRAQVPLDGLVFLRREAITDGWTDRQIQAKVRSGEWHRIRHGAYVDGAVWESLSKGDRYRLLCRADLRTAHPTAVLTHVSATVEVGAPTWGLDLTDVHLTRTDGKAGRRESGVVHHRGALPEEQVVLHRDVRISVPARAAVEVCSIVEVETALVTVNHLLHAEEMTHEEFSEMASATRSWPHSLTTDIVVRLADPRIESVGESRTDHLCWSQHLPRPTPQVTLRDRQGNVVARVDFAWVEHGVFLEFDGREKYSRFRRKGETLEAFLLREKKREELICAMTGWVCIRITWEDLATPVATARRIRSLLESRSRPVGA